MYDNFIFRIKRTVYKWWCVVYKPVYRLIHDGNWPASKEPSVRYPDTQPSTQETGLDAQALADAVLDTNRQSQHSIDDMILEASKHTSDVAQAVTPVQTSHTEASVQETSALDSDAIPADVDDDVLARANEIMARLNREAAEDEEKKQREIEAAKKQTAEQERLAAILKSNERNIDAFIQEGLSKQHQQDDSNQERS